MITDTEIKKKGIQALIGELGSVGMEKFIALIQREPFDYTKWQRSLWIDHTVEELSKEAKRLRENEQEK
jgi:glutamyl-tRNA reductase